MKYLIYQVSLTRTLQFNFAKFFNEIDFVDIVKEDYLLEEINEKIKRYDFKLEDFFEEVEGKTNLKSNDIFNSKKGIFLNM